MSATFNKVFADIFNALPEPKSYNEEVERKKRKAIEEIINGLMNQGRNAVLPFNESNGKEYENNGD